MWNIVEYANAGRRNLDRGLKCQDYTHYEEFGTVQVITLADGTGKDDFARLGAGKSCEVLGKLLSENYEQIYNMENEHIRFNIAVNLKTELDLLCDQHNVQIEQLQSTLLGLAIDHTSGTFIAVHLGDGQIEIGRKGMRRIISYPENGNSKGQTWLTSMRKIGDHLRIIKGDIRDIEEFILSSDGWPDQESKTRHEEKTDAAVSGEHSAENTQEYVDDVSFISLALKSQ